MRLILVFLIFTTQAITAKEYNLDLGWGIYPDKKGHYLYSNSSLIVRELGKYESQRDGIGYSLFAKNHDHNSDYPWISPRKFKTVLKSKSGKSFTINQDGFFHNGKLLCGYNDEYRSNDPLYDSRIFNWNCAHKYGLVSYKQQLSPLIGLKVSDDKEPHYLFEGEKYYPVSEFDGYIVKIMEDSYTEIRKEYLPLIDEFEKCFKRDDCLFYSENINKKKLSKYIWPTQLFSPESANKYKGFSPRVLNSFEKCQLTLPREKPSERLMRKLELYVIDNCLKDLIIETLKYAKVSQRENRFIFLGQDIKFGLEIIKIKGTKKFRLFQINFTGDVLFTDTSYSYRPSKLCRTERHKEECKFWEGYFQKNGWESFYTKTNFPVVPNSEIEKLVKDKYEYTGKQ
ncbi:hypothetical protein [Bacteriovorax sp. DB6_IX]|uniref:hypothetical protein n=1 Tax=Bacteriovorax sp. DB6_IX TaxID=1353530 RepID=UPI00038A22EE|nr:hypothetical protein [Bacteriovorax sp. DB6_IX]EQC51253.1 hypothetical protein M901_1108 [Bacteriovorax sp. DB6_IX]